MIEINADLHIHGLYSGGVSDRMIPSVIGEQAPLKGIQLVGTGDILNGRWLKLVKEQLSPEGDLFTHSNGTRFILQAEVEDMNRVHHIIFFPSLSKVEEVREALQKHCKDLDTDGRPKLHTDGESIAEVCHEAGCMIGWAHAFTPYFGLYSKYKSYKDCYGSQAGKIRFMELGLSADTGMADRIAELEGITFLSNSDCHSPWPNKLGREFNRLLVREISFEEIRKALAREGGRACLLNVKFNPKEGKYHATRCRDCLMFFSPADARKLQWRCPECKGIIKKGVLDLVEELAAWPEPKHPGHRAKCVHIIPLSEIIALAIGVKQPWSIKVQELWQKYVDRFGNEINALIDAPIEEIRELSPEVATYIEYFRADRFQWVPGGAGVYGKPVPPGRKAELKIWRHRQTSLGKFVK